MRNELFMKLINHETVKDVPLLYIIKVFTAIQEIYEKDKAEQENMEIS